MPYKQGVTGSSPVAPTTSGPVVQMVRMPACHAGGRRFEPDPGRHFFNYHTRWRGSTVEQLICNQQVVGSIPIASSNMEGFPSGQRGRTVNPLAELSMVRIHLPPPICMRKWLRGRASPCQGEGREFESRLPLQFCGCSSMVELQPSKLIA